MRACDGCGSVRRTEDSAVANGLAVHAIELGWDSESETRTRRS